MSSEAAAFVACIERGGVAVFPADTVYGLACDPLNAAAVARLYELKGRPAEKPAAVMWFDREAALAALADLPPRTRAAVERLTPGPVTLLLPNPARLFPLAAGPSGDARTLGVRVPAVRSLGGTRVVVLQSSANESGGADARRVEDMPERIRRHADLVLDAGPLPGTPSTVIDLCDFEREGAWRVVRAGALAAEGVARALGIVGRR